MQQVPRSPSESYFWPVVLAVGLHALLFAMLFVSFSQVRELPPSKPVIQATLYQLQSESQATQQSPHKLAGEAQRASAPVYEAEQMEQKKNLEEGYRRKAAAEAAQKKAAEEAAKKAAAEAAKKAAEAEAARKAAVEVAQKKAAADAARKAADEAAKKAAAEAAKKKAAEEAKKKADAEAAK